MDIRKIFLLSGLLLGSHLTPAFAYYVCYAPPDPSGTSDPSDSCAEEDLSY